jgi:LPS-assembly protein
LRPSLHLERRSPNHFRNIIAAFCHGFFFVPSFIGCFNRCLQGLLVFSTTLLAQPGQSPYFSIPRAADAQVPASARSRKLPARPDAVPRSQIAIEAVSQEVEGSMRRLRGHAKVEVTEMVVWADQIDYNEDNGDVDARGNVHYRNFETGEELWAARVEYNLAKETGKFYQVRGTASARILPRPGILTSPNPFYFQSQWAERMQDRYILHDGFVTDCKIPRPWWTLHAPKFDVIPGQRALAYRAVFRLRWLPMFYAPVFYKSLEKEPRKSGFLTPNIGNSSSRGKMIGVGYFWAINRSFDVMYLNQYFTQRGFAHHVDFRGKPRPGTDFNFILYGVNDRGALQSDGTRIKQGGFLFSLNGSTDLGHGFEGKANVNYLSSFVFRQTFTESFNEAIFSEVHSVAYISKHWSSYDLDFIFARNENFQSTEPNDKIVIRKLPQVEFGSRDRQVVGGDIPIWVGLEATAGLLQRDQLLYQTRQFTERMDFAPRVTTAFGWKGFRLLPTFSIRERHYGAQQQGDQISGQNLDVSAREFDLELTVPSLERIFDGPSWLGQKVKHVVEPVASFRYVGGVEDFKHLVRFDETELMSNTTEAEIGLINRLYAKRNGEVREVLSWEVWQRRYFDPTFGGAITPDYRNVLLSSVELTPYAFLDQARNYSPVVSALHINPVPGYGIEWRSDYDPLRHGFVNNSISADARRSRYYVSLGHNMVHSVSALSPNANQFRGTLGIGNDDRRGWNAGFNAVYDFREGHMQYATTQVTYNTDCCGFSVQFRRFSFGTRNENQFRLSFAVANIGSFGTLKKQERMF